MLDDGRQVGFTYGGVHWDVAHLLLDEVLPDPSRDGTVRLWYRGVAAFFANRWALVESAPHLERARRLFPTDPDIFAASGSLYETFAAPPLQDVAKSLAQGGFPVSIGPTGANLRRAETFFRRAVELDDGFTEARVRLGRVMGLQGRHGDAAAQLKQAMATEGDSLTRYYASLFLGTELQALGDLDEARRSFERAAALYPRAQSPHLALSQLARRSGDRAGASSRSAMSSCKAPTRRPTWIKCERR
jgi:tetratricopeptide (TPR) repeat protein